MTDRPLVRNIGDLAKLAGVSAGTVSRALTDSGLIAQTTRERIKALAREHDFHPNLMARNLRIQKAGAIGVIIPLGHEKGQHLSDPFFMQLLGHLADELSERGQNLLLSRIIPQQADWLSRIVDSGQVDGVIVVGQSDQTQVLDAVARRYRPLVVWGAQLPDQAYCSVGSDNYQGGALAGAHLAAQGCRSIALFGDPRAPEVALRLDGCRAALRESGIDVPTRVLPVHLTEEYAYRDIARYLDTSGERIDGVFAVSDVMAMTTLRVLAERGLSAPGDVKVVGFDDLPLATMTNPPLTTVRQNLAEGARLLVDLLFRRIAGEETRSVLMPAALVVRGSSAISEKIKPQVRPILA